MRLFLYILLMLVTWSLPRCGHSGKSATSKESIADIKIQTILFSKLVTLVDGAIPENVLNDSLAFLLLPLEASCPSCRNKTISAISNNEDNLGQRKYIIISANAGRKTMRAIFRERNEELPSDAGNIILDSTNQAFKMDLSFDKPTIYYAYEKRVYEKVASVPSTIKTDLNEYFHKH